MVSTSKMRCQERGERATRTFRECRSILSSFFVFYPQEMRVQCAAPRPKGRVFNHLRKYRTVSTNLIYFIYIWPARHLSWRLLRRVRGKHTPYETGYRIISPLFQLQPVSCFSSCACGHDRRGGCMAHKAHEQTSKCSYNSPVACSVGVMLSCLRHLIGQSTSTSPQHIHPILFRLSVYSKAPLMVASCEKSAINKRSSCCYFKICTVPYQPLDQKPTH